MPKIPPVIGISAPPSTNKNKGDRGWVNVATGRPLCPRELIEEFDQDPQEYVPVF